MAVGFGLAFILLLGWVLQQDNPGVYIGALFTAFFLLIMFFVYFFEGPHKECALYKDKKRTLRRLKKRIDSISETLSSKNYGTNDGVHCVYCGHIYKKGDYLCSACGAPIVLPETDSEASNELRRLILEKDELIKLENKTQKEIVSAQEIKINEVRRFFVGWGIAAVVLNGAAWWLVFYYS